MLFGIGAVLGGLAIVAPELPSARSPTGTATQVASRAD
jgi:hypothetical protein